MTARAVVLPRLAGRFSSRRPLGLLPAPAPSGRPRHGSVRDTTQATGLRSLTVMTTVHGQRLTKGHLPPRVRTPPPDDRAGAHVHHGSGGSPGDRPAAASTWAAGVWTFPRTITSLTLSNGEKNSPRRHRHGNDGRATASKMRNRRLPSALRASTQRRRNRGSTGGPSCSVGGNVISLIDCPAHRSLARSARLLARARSGHRQELARESRQVTGAHCQAEVARRSTRWSRTTPAQDRLSAYSTGRAGWEALTASATRRASTPGRAPRRPHRCRSRPVCPPPRRRRRSRCNKAAVRLYR